MESSDDGLGPLPGDRSSVFTEEEEGKIIQAFLKRRGDAPVSPAEIEEILFHCYQIRMGNLLLNMLMAGICLVDMDENAIKFPFDPDATFDIEDNPIADEIEHILQNKDWGMDAPWHHD